MKYKNISYYVIFPTEKNLKTISLPNILLIFFSTLKLKLKLAARSFEFMANFDH